MPNTMGRFPAAKIAVRRGRDIASRGRATPFETTVTDVLARGHVVRFRADGDSMYPSIQSGEYISVAPLASGATWSVGDVVLARAHRGLTAHRIIDLQSN